MKNINIFKERLKRIGIEVELQERWPLVLLRKVNGKIVKGLYLSEFGFTAFYGSLKAKSKDTAPNIKILFKKIRETLCLN